jgi:hypothetical protein
MVPEFGLNPTHWLPRQGSLVELLPLYVLQWNGSNASDFDNAIQTIEIERCASETNRWTCDKHWAAYLARLVAIFLSMLDDVVETAFQPMPQPVPADVVPDPPRLVASNAPSSLFVLLI